MRVLSVMVVVCALAGALLARGASIRMHGRWVPEGRRIVYGALAGAGAGFVLLPLLGLAAGLVLVAASLAVLAAIGYLILMVVRGWNRSRL